MKLSPQRSARAARLHGRAGWISPVKRRPSRGASRVTLGGLRLLQIYARGMPAWRPWAPTVLDGIYLRRGRGRCADAMDVDPRPRRRGRQRVDLDDGEHRHRVRGVVPPVLGDGAHAVADEEENIKLDHNYCLDAKRWMGTINGEDMGGLEDSAMIYQPYFTAQGDNQEDSYITSQNKLLVDIYEEMLDTYMEIYKVSTEKWKVKRNVDELPWELVKELIRQANQQLKVAFDRYDSSERYSTAIREKLERLFADPLQKPLILEKSPSRFDFKKEKKEVLKLHKKEVKESKMKGKLPKGSGSGKRDGSGSGKRDGSGSASGSGKRDGSGSGNRDGSARGKRGGSASEKTGGSGSRKSGGKKTGGNKKYA